MTTVLAAPGRMEDESRCGVPSKPCHLQCIRYQAALHVRLHAQAHQPSRPVIGTADPGCRPSAPDLQGWPRHLIRQREPVLAAPALPR